LAIGDGHPIEPLPDVRRTDARSAQICSPNGVVRAFQVNVYRVEPHEASRARNLLSKDDCRLALADEVEEGRPQVPLVGKSCFLVLLRGAEGLARAAAGPHGPVTGPSSQLERIRPPSDACKEVTLIESCEI
jgi:hypothetical protein